MIRKTHTAITLATLALATPAMAATESSSSASNSNTATPQVTAGADSICKNGFVNSDSNGDGIISQDEVTAVRDQTFNALDADGNGELSRAEYVDCMNQSARSAVGGDTPKSGGENAEIPDFAGLDTNGNGAVDTQEYMGATHDARQQAAAGDNPDAILLLRRYVFVPAGFEDNDITSMSDEETASRSARQFRMFDDDQSGDISEEEWSNASSMKNDISEVLNMEYDGLDADASGTISSQEFSDAGTEGWSSAYEKFRNAARQSGTNADASGSSEEDTRTSQAETGTAGNRGSGGEQTPPVVYFRYFAPLDAG
ncbi:hypothetical protein [Pseudooceanicola sp.]|uniref:hypothetical protein n=1 Tax=Pseudooceanicola sp. TaxID=1914328 RepID=UPI0035C67EB2